MACASCVYRYLCDLPESVTDVRLWSDSCGGQNRNQFIAAMYLFAVQKLPIKTISANLLETGHTQMECDTMHACIEHEVKGKKMFYLNDWENVCVSARRNRPEMGKKPFITLLTYKDFLDFKKLGGKVIKNRSKDSDGSGVNWMKIKQLFFEKEIGLKIFLKYRHDEEHRCLPVSGLGCRGRPQLIEDPVPAYTKSLPISKAKKDDLVKLCNKHLIPEIYAHWYRGLCCSNKATDRLEISEDEDDE